MDVVFPFALLCFTSLFTITNPLSMMPVFLTMTHSMDEKARRAIVKKASIIACITLILFVLAGQFLFKFFGISTDGFRIVGGFIIFRIGYDMLQAKYTSVKLKDEEIKEYDDINIRKENDLILGLRLIDGINYKMFNNKYDDNLLCRDIIKKLIDSGKLEIYGDYIRCNYKYIYLLNDILVEIMESDL